MISRIMTPGMIAFVERHKHDFTADLLLRCNENTSFDIKCAVTQIECRRKTVAKLARFNAFSHFYYPSVLAAEQASNAEVAAYHSTLIEPHETVADLTAGLGIDIMSIAEKAEKAFAFERNTETNAALKYNAKVCGLDNLTVIAPCDSIEYLRRHALNFGTIFIDPARRDLNMRRTYAFADCEPDVVEHQKLLLDRAERVFIKASPMLDVTSICRQLANVKSVRAVSWRGECKEVLVELVSGWSGKIDFIAINITTEGEVQQFSCADNAEEDSLYNGTDVAGKFIYEPNASVMKMGTRAGLCVKFPRLYKSDKNTSIYISDEKYDDFPGKMMYVTGEITKRDKKQYKGKYYNIVSRNHPLKPEQIKKMLQTKDGGDEYIYAFTYAGKKIMVTCIHQ